MSEWFKIQEYLPKGGTIVWVLRSNGNIVKAWHSGITPGRFRSYEDGIAPGYLIQDAELWHAIVAPLGPDEERWNESCRAIGELVHRLSGFNNSRLSYTEPDDTPQEVFVEPGGKRKMTGRELQPHPWLVNIYGPGHKIIAVGNADTAQETLEIALDKIAANSEKG